ncbi:carboxypeptidase-like regulatory domain-containing protein [Dysgonomonas sp. Marseille-P4677]|uniref:carboxypeptidase regulatory-like domain-containing protein n=1 Tax=Dysgonomonas sp. Marseille-P4677 TaxID=2364790 RepID=UPI001914D1B4|nr:carboxypeptidase regulatory-like domain-containing protein [Dysgonomonas sp. Marseille-P4677]MBK5722092.1 carboxypeptidase-like regulatory domain-containing protein [Dysgonomonas sp. Marseille-P4677]
MDFNKKRLLYLIVLFLLFVLNISGQTINLSGRVLSQKSQVPIEFANITLSKQDSVLLDGTITDSIGYFEFKNLASDDYILSASCLGFETKNILIQNLAESAKLKPDPVRCSSAPL